jgi:hypothetical protein
MAAIPFSTRTQIEIARKGASAVWNEVLALSRMPGVIDLGQGWPDYGADETARRAVRNASAGAPARGGQGEER